MDMEGAVEDAQAVLDTQLQTLNTALETNPDQGMQQLFISWFQTMPFDAEARESGFAPAIPRDLLPFDEEVVAQGVTRLDGVQWIHDPFLGAEIGFTVVPQAENDFEIVALIRTMDAKNIQDIVVFPTDAISKNVEDSAENLWVLTRGAQREFEANSDAAHAKFLPLFERDDLEIQNDNTVELGPAWEWLDNNLDESDEMDVEDEIEDEFDEPDLEGDWDTE
jgi:hypothetical protein